MCVGKGVYYYKYFNEILAVITLKMTKVMPQIQFEDNGYYRCLVIKLQYPYI
jgi:hypothetical protein